jgi:acyl carrier protein
MNDRACAVRALIAGLAGTDDFDDDQDLMESGVLQSVQIVELVVLIGETFPIALDADDISEGRLATVRRIAALVHARSAAA